MTAQQAAALEATCKEEQSKFDELRAKGGGDDGIANLVSFRRAVTCDRLRPQITVTLNKFYSEAECRNEQGKFDALNAKGDNGAGVENLKAFAKTVTCEALRPLVTGAIERFTAEAAKRAATAPNAPPPWSSRPRPNWFGWAVRCRASRTAF
jgi:hypothetical protein